MTQLSTGQKPKEIKPVAKGSIKKEPLGKKFKRIFLSEDINTVGDFIFIDVFVPAIKDLVANIIYNTTNVVLYGKSSASGYLRPGSPQNQQQRASLYWNSAVSGSRAYVGQSQPTSQNVRAANNFRDIVYPERAKAEAVLNELYALITTYGCATVSDIYQLSGISSDNFTNNDYGWTNLQGSGVSRTRDGFVLDLPKPILLPQ